MDAEQAKWYLAGLIDGEGHIQCSYGCRQVSVSNTDKSIIDRAVECCEVLKYHWRLEEPRLTKIGKLYWQLVISRRETMERLIAELPLGSEVKLAILDQIADEYSCMKPLRKELTVTDIQEIRSRRLSGREYARRYNRSPTVISYIQNGLRYKGVS